MGVGLWGELKPLLENIPLLILPIPRVAVLPGLVDNIEQECKVLSLDFKLERETEMLHNYLPGT